MNFAIANLCLPQVLEIMTAKTAGVMPQAHCITTAKMVAVCLTGFRGLKTEQMDLHYNFPSREEIEVLQERKLLSQVI